MPAERVSMRRVREILRYRFEQGLGHKAISVRVGAAPSTVRETLRRAAAAGLTWPLGEDLGDSALEAALYHRRLDDRAHRPRRRRDRSLHGVALREEPLDAKARHDLLEILEERYGRRSTIITSQLPISAWHEVIGDPTYADAILDRLVHNAHRLELDGDSMRRPKTQSQA